MATKVAYLAENLGQVDNAWNLSLSQFLLATGGNVGNLAFWHAARLLFDATDVQLISRDTRPSDVAADVEVVVIPAANFLHDGADLGRMADLIRALGRPVLILGLGAQAEKEDVPPKLKPGTLDFLREVGRLSPKILVRGQFTQDFCRSLGVENTTVLGCPSLLINPDQALGAKLEARIAALPQEGGPLAVHGACIKPALAGIERELVRLVRLNPGSAYIIQRPLELIKAAFGAELGTPAEVEYFARCAAFLGLGESGALTAFLRAHGEAPTSVSGWAHSLQRYSAGVNTRIHGTMMGVLAGLPSICICHDTRTRELAEQMQVPKLSPREFIEHRHSVRDMFAATGFSGKRFDAGRSEAAAGFLTAVEAVGLKPSRHLRRFLDA
ncbi:polysaccharide pyruvyl transferase family protein [Muricoccus vinaceus]|uniref:Polysaccharide pyruvyl transferase family protein n=1 Tax=Muricoccus vinaceus TaxID=424704 RepID=A0ABV6IZW6_9PROT